MKTAEFTKGQQIKVKNFTVSIGSFDTGDVALFSNHSGEFVKLERTKVSTKLRKVKRQLKSWINNDKDFCFQFMTPEATQKLIDILKQ